MLSMSARCLITAVLAFAALHGPTAHAEDGVTSDKIVFGQPAALEGPASALGQGMRQGLLAAFAEANAAGGVKGHKLELISADEAVEKAQDSNGMRDKLLAMGAQLRSV